MVECVKLETCSYETNDSYRVYLNLQLHAQVRLLPLLSSHRTNRLPELSRLTKSKAKKKN